MESYSFILIDHKITEYKNIQKLYSLNITTNLYIILQDIIKLHILNSINFIQLYISNLFITQQVWITS